MSFYYLFIPTWFFTILIYTFLASKYGAKEKYPEALAKEESRNKEITNFQDQKAMNEPVIPVHYDNFSKSLKGISLVTLAITIVLAGITLFASPDVVTYESNREIFYFYGFICTVVYFVTAYWAMKRSKGV